MKANVEDVWDMPCKEFNNNLKNLEAILSEERYVLQRQLDNHIKIKSSKTIDSFKDIYIEFSEQMGRVIINNNVEVSVLDMKKKHRENLAKMGLR